ncbi:hypothetical protein MKW92_027445 [Papaver armeniacum]|nr:hypothetical protein MKW92_027445 [Papaver armeniacum]
MRVIRGSQAQRYNCQVLCYNRKILMIRPKFCLANDGNYRELRWFTAWKQTDQVEEFQLPPDLHDRLDAFKGATHTSGGVYMYSNQQGCDGGRLYYDGCSCVVVNGKVVAQGSQFSLEDVEVLVAQVDLDAVKSNRGSISCFHEQASCKTKVSYITAPYKLCQSFNPKNFLSDSSVAAIVGCMCQLVVKEVANGNEQVKADAIRIGHYTDGLCPTDSKEFAKRIFYTVFMGTENSSDTTSSPAKLLAAEIGSWHLDVSLDNTYCTGKRPVYKVDGGSDAENLGLQNIQARIRMVLAYMLASLLPWAHSKPGFFLVLGSSNYDCSSADINPIGSVSKQDLRAFLKWAALEPIRSNYSQLDEISFFLFLLKVRAVLYQGILIFQHCFISVPDTDLILHLFAIEVLESCERITDFVERYFWRFGENMMPPVLQFRCLEKHLSLWSYYTTFRLFTCTLDLIELI